MSKRLPFLGFFMTLTMFAAGQSTKADSLKLVEAYQAGIRQCLKLSAAMDSILDAQDQHNNILIDTNVVHNLIREFNTLSDSLPREPDHTIRGVINSFKSKIDRFEHRLARLAASSVVGYRPIREVFVTQLLALQNDVDNFREYMVAVQQNKFYDAASKQLQYIHRRQDADTILFHAIQDSVDTALAMLRLKSPDSTRKADTCAIEPPPHNKNPGDKPGGRPGDTVYIDTCLGKNSPKTNTIHAQPNHYSTGNLRSTRAPDTPKTKPPKPFGKNMLAIAGYEHSIYGISYYHLVDSATLPLWVGAELILPSEQSYAKDPGGFLFAAFQKENFIFQLGLGVFDNKVQSANISWKAGLTYYFSKLGMGLHYSPFTGVGVGLHYRLERPYRRL